MGINLGQTGQSPIYEEQQQAGKTVSHLDTGSRWEINGVAVGLATKLSVSPGAANVCNFTLAVQDLAQNVSGTSIITVWLSDSPFGAGFAAHVPTGGLLLIGPPATLVFSKVTNLAIEILTGQFGTAALSITDTAKTGYYICATVPGTGLVAVSPQLITANYG
jgi:hypothetical protein